MICFVYNTIRRMCWCRRMCHLVLESAFSENKYFGHTLRFHYLQTADQISNNFQIKCTIVREECLVQL